MDRNKKRNFVCYFCNKRIENESEMGHTSVCGNVLLPCPQKCGAYVRRMEMQAHRKDCLNRVGRTTSRDQVETGKVGNHTASLDRRPTGQKDFRELFFTIQKDLQTLTNRITNYEQVNSNGLAQSESFSAQEPDNVKHQNQLLLEWKKTVDLKLDVLKQTANNFERLRNENDAKFARIHEKLQLVDKIQKDLASYRESVLNEQNYNQQVNVEFARKLDGFKQRFDEENAEISAICSEHKSQIIELQSQMLSLNHMLEEHKTKQISMGFDVKTVSGIASETADKLEIQERDFGEMKKQMEQLKLDIEILEDLAGDRYLGSTTPGYLLWKVGNFEEKMMKAKGNESVVKSPIFYTHEFGYRIRLLLYPNGLKKWKDRYALISLRVLKGDFDALLKWPCHIEATVSLRDVEDLQNPRNLAKYVTAKRQSGDEETEEPQESSSSYIFIPHTTLIKSKYFKDNTIYIDVRVKQNEKLRAETSL